MDQKYLEREFERIAVYMDGFRQDLIATFWMRLVQLVLLALIAWRVW